MAVVSTERHPDLPPPNRTAGPVAWIYANLFSSPLNIALSVAALLFIGWVFPPIIDWAFLSADWIGDSREDCTSGGACWVFVYARFQQFMYGFYPAELRWRVDLGFLVLIALAAPLFVKAMPKKWILVVLLIFVYPFVAFALFYGVVDPIPGDVVGEAHPLRVVETSRWGGLFLTLVVAGVGIAASLPIGIVLALGRRSHMPFIRAVCVVFIEFWRGVPLITVLFMASVMLPLFLPEGVNFNKLLRCLIGVSLFASAYMAEVVRGGLQAIPKGQYEAAQALGLSYWKSMGLIILPQALKHVIPGIVNTFIGLFKDTTLVLIIGLFDLLGIVQAAATDPHWLGYSIEGYVFAGFVFWIFCFGMSRYSQHLERRLHTGHKR